MMTRSRRTIDKVEDENCNLKTESLEEVRSFVHTSAIPETLQSREDEYNAIRMFVINCIKPNGASASMYISGVPGTGKTTTTMAVLHDLENEDYQFKKVVVNAMELEDPKSLFVLIYRQIQWKPKKRISVAAARRALNLKFERATAKKEPIVILVDELDMLCTKRQEVLYDIFNWTSNEAARVSVIAISNTLDLPERVMSKRITSRLGTNRVIFQPYTYPQIEEILTSKFANLTLVHNQAIEYVSKKVANVTGDIRKAMDLVRRGIEIAVKEEDEMLRFEHVIEAQKEASISPRDLLGMNLSQHEFILFRSALSHIHSTGQEEAKFYELYKDYRVLCTSLEGVNPLNDYAVQRMLMKLCGNRLLRCSSDKNFLLRRIYLGMSTREAENIIKAVENTKKAIINAG